MKNSAKINMKFLPVIITAANKGKLSWVPAYDQFIKLRIALNSFNHECTACTGNSCPIDSEGSLG